MAIALILFALLCLGCALFFALDYYRVKRERDYEHGEAEYERGRMNIWRTIAVGYAEELNARDTPRDNNGRFVKRGK